jgi:hypothetical protein
LFQNPHDEEEQLASKVLFAVTDCYGQAAMSPVGPNEFQVSVLRLQLRFFCQGDEIIFSEIRAASQDDVDAFARCFGQQPQLAAEGQQILIGTLPGGEPIPANEEKAVSVVDSLREQLFQLSKTTSPEEEPNAEEAQEQQPREEENNEDTKNKEEKGGSSDFELFA